MTYPGRWEGGFGMGNTCKPMAVSFQCMTNSTTNKKNKNKKKNKLKKKKKRMTYPEVLKVLSFWVEQLRWGQLKKETTIITLT